MTVLLETKELLVSIYKKFEKLIQPGAKFLLALIVLSKLTNYMLQFGGGDKLDVLNKASTSAALSIIVAFVPGSWFVLLLVLLISARLFFISMEATFIVFVVMMVLYLMFVRLYPQYAYLTILVPLMFVFKLGYVLPVFAGLFIGPAAILSMAVGVVIYFMSGSLPGLLRIQSAEMFDMPSTLLGMYRYFMDSVGGNREMILTIAVFAIVVVVVYTVSKLEMDYIFFIAIGAGVATNLICFIIGNIILGAQVSIGGAFLGSIVAAIIVGIMQFFRFNLDYQKAEKVQFEDDDYFYYVKAIPKIKVAKAKKEIKTIH